MRRIVLALVAVAFVAAACSDPAPLSGAAAITPAPTGSSEPTPAPPTAAPLPSTRKPLSPQDSVTTAGSGVEPGAAGTVVHSRVGIGDEYYPFLGNPGYDVQAIRFEELVNASLSQQAGGGIEGRYESLWRNESAASTIGELVLDSSRLAQYSGWLTTLLADSESPLAGTVRFVIDDRGYAATGGTLTQRIADVADIVDIPGGSAAKNGFGQTFEPSTFSVGLAMLADTIDATRASGSEFVLFNMPEHGDKFLSRDDGAARYESYVEALSNLAAEKGIVFVDFTNADASIYADDEPFADFHHMTPDGAKDLTQRLADEFISGSLRGLLGAIGA